MRKDHPNQVVWDMRNDKRSKVNVLVLVVGVTRMDGVRSKEVSRRAGIESELASRVLS